MSDAFLQKPETGRKTAQCVTQRPARTAPRRTLLSKCQPFYGVFTPTWKVQHSVLWSSRNLSKLATRSLHWLSPQSVVPTENHYCLDQKHVFTAPIFMKLHNHSATLHRYFVYRIRPKSETKIKVMVKTSVALLECKVTFKAPTSIKLQSACFQASTRKAPENCALPGCYAASNGNFIPTFRYNLSVPYSWVNPIDFFWVLDPLRWDGEFYPKTSVWNYKLLAV